VTGTAPAPARAPLIRSGAVPPLADGFITRPRSAAGVTDLVPGTAVALVPADGGRPGQPAGPCGKTQLAARYARTAGSSGQVDMVFWVDASSRASALSGYLQAAAAAGTSTAGRAEHAAARLTRWLAAAGSPWLMVLDDLRDPADLDGIWPAGPAGRVLITAPGQDAVRDPGGEPRALTVPVGAFSPREALNYLMTRLAGGTDQRHGALDLALALEGDPCALARASAVITATGWTCRDYQQRYTAARSRLAARQAPGYPPAPAAVTWVLSAERAGRLLPGPATGLLLALAAVLDGQPVPGQLLSAPAVRAWLAQAGAAAPGADHARDAARALEECGLISIDPPPAPPAIRMSRFTAALARAAQPGHILEQAAHAAADALVQIWPQPEPEPGPAAVLRSCADALQRTAPDALWQAGAWHPLLARAGHSLEGARLTGPAVRHWTQLAAASSRLAGPDSPQTMTAASHLAQALLAAGHPARAARWWQWVAAHHARLSGADHPATLAAQTGLGRATAAAGQPGRAITILEQAVAGCERASGPGHPDTVRARNALAAACQAAGQPGRAISCYQHNLTCLESRHGPRHPAALTARDTLAAACQDAGRLDEAISCYQQALTGRQHTLGADHPDTITTRRHLAAACHAAGKIAAALHHHDQARASCERALGPAHPDTLACRADLATAYRNAGHLTDATTLLRDTLTICEQALPPGHHLTSTIRHTLTSITSGR